MKYKTEVVIAICVLFALGMGHSLYKKISSAASVPAEVTPLESKTVDRVESKDDSQKEVVQTNKNTLTNNTQKNMEKTIATMHTNKGDITIEFFDTLTPNTVSNFVKLSKSGFYDGVKFHRVIKDFMIQGGDPLSKDDSMKDMWGTGGPGYKFNDEVTPQNSNVAGTISMANAGPNTNGSQFFINVRDNNFLDTKHTVFGKVVEGMDVVRAIEATPTDSTDKPIDSVVIKSISFK